MGRVKTDAELAWDRVYGGKTERELKEITRGMVGKKLNDFRARAVQRQAENDAKYNLPYGELVKVLLKTEEQIIEMEEKPEKLLSAERARLEAEYADLFMRGMADTNKELWISERLVRYMQNPEGNYRSVKSQLAQARADYAIYLSKKEEWEQENADIIEAERIRTKRAELMQADPEILRSLGIEPEVGTATVTGTGVDGGKSALREALKAIHPSASDTEIERMVNLV